MFVQVILIKRPTRRIWITRIWRAFFWIGILVYIKYTMQPVMQWSDAAKSIKFLIC